MVDKQKFDESMPAKTYKWIVDNMPFPVIITVGPVLEEQGYDRNEIVYVNDAFTRMTGYREEEILGDTPKKLQGPKTDRRVLDRLKEQLNDQEGFVGETVNYRQDGEEYRVRWRVDPIRTNEGITHWISVQEDVSDDPLANGFKSDETL